MVPSAILPGDRFHAPAHCGVMGRSSPRRSTIGVRLEAECERPTPDDHSRSGVRPGVVWLLIFCMTTTLTDKPPCTHREQQPVRACVRCGAYLRSFGNDAYCDPCSKGETTLNDSEVFELISEMPDVRARRKAFDALVEMHAEAA